MESKTIEVWPVGSVVRFHTGEVAKENVRGVINQIRIQGHDYVDYQVIYWKDGDRKTAWVEEYEFTADDGTDKKRRIGFKNGD